MKTYIDTLTRAQRFAADILPEPELLAPQSPADFVAWVEKQSSAIDHNLGGISDEDLETAGGPDAWRALVIRCVAELASEVTS